MLLLNIYPRTIECRCLNLTDTNNYLYTIFSECQSGLLKNITCSLYKGRIFSGQEIRNYKFYQCPFVPRLAVPSKQCALATHDSASREVYIPQLSSPSEVKLPRVSRDVNQKLLFCSNPSMLYLGDSRRATAVILDYSSTGSVSCYLLYVHIKINNFTYSLNHMFSV